MALRDVILKGVYKSSFQFRKISLLKMEGHEGKTRPFTPLSRQKMPVINIEDLTEKDKLKMEVDQLKKEVTLERMLVSKCCEEFRDYVEERSGEDPLVKGIPEDKNPFKELKGGCVIS
ncbi:hypothetical protein E5288_WYG001395 [Bos mutus]|uniref:Guanine nucleotide-binding protein subunit gamma n=1 Tax=Bos mutus TaxID=72004 RepID=A0A6B0R322_9CETA|nr:hypothetical protein [Bos mutus]